MLRIRTLFVGVAGSPWYSTMHFAGEGQAVAQIAADAVSAFWTSMAPDLANSVGGSVEPEVAVVDPLTGEALQFHTVEVDPFTGTGGVAAERMPGQDQMIVTLTTQGVVAGRRVRGRLFIPGLTEFANVAGAPNPLTVTAVQGRVNALLATPESIPVIWSRPVVEIPGPIRAGSEHDVTAATVRPYWAVLRSRRD